MISKLNLSLLVLIFILKKNCVECIDENEEMSDLSNQNFNLVFAIRKTIVGPRCIPLKSKNIAANPYHPSLVSRRGAEIRKGLGSPRILNQNPLSCPFDSPEDCTFSVERSFSTTVSNSYSISIGNSKSFSKSLGTSSSTGRSSSISNSISKSMEQSLSKSIALTDEESISDEISKQLSATHEKSSGLTKIEAREVSETNSITHESTDTKSESKEKTSGITKNEEESEQNSKGGAKSIGNSQTEENSKSNQESSSESNTKSNTFETNFHMSRTVSVEVGGFFVKGSASGTIGGGLSDSNTNSKTNEKSKSKTTSESNSKTKSENLEENWNSVKTKSSSTSKSDTESLGQSNSFAVSNGKSNSKTNGHSSSSAAENRASDSISLSLSAAKSYGKAKSKQDSTSESSGFSYNINDGFSSNNETSISNNFNQEDSISISSNTEKRSEKSYTMSVSANQVYYIRPGECKILVCFPFVISAAIPYECIDESDNGEFKKVHTEMMLIDNSTTLDGNLTCAQSLIDCKNKNKANFFINNNMNFLMPDLTDSYSRLEFGKEIYSNTQNDSVIMISNSMRFQLVLFKEGNLAIKRYRETLWQSEMNFFNDSKTRIRINEKGHLIQEMQAKHLFANEIPNYEQQDWITIWSSAPINHNVTIGTPYDADGNSYVLVLSDSGVLNLYDAVGALIWCTDEDCQHRFGYKFPEVYLVPIISESAEFFTPVEDNNHSSINRLVKKTDFEYIVSLNKRCSGLSSNKAILSPNKRFKLILEDSGNLIIKDGARTMWESLSGYIEHGISPYKLLLTPTCNLIIVSKNGYLIWMSILKEKKTKDSECRLKIQDEGRLVVIDNEKNEVWESWPMRGMNDGVTFFEPIEYKYVPCDGKPFINKKYLMTESNSSYMLNDTNIISKNGLWDMAILKEKKLVIRKLNVIKFEIYTSSKKINKLVIEDEGYLKLIGNSSKKTETVWKHRFADSNLDQKPYILELSDKGVLSIKNKNNVTVWNFNGLELDSNELNSLKTGEYLKSNSTGNEWKLKLLKDKFKISKNANIQNIEFMDFFKKCYKTGIEAHKMLLLNGSIALYDFNNEIICDTYFESNHSPFKLTLNNKSGLVEIFNFKNEMVWQNER